MPPARRSVNAPVACPCSVAPPRRACARIISRLALRACTGRLALHVEAHTFPPPLHHGSRWRQPGTRGWRSALPRLSWALGAVGRRPLAPPDTPSAPRRRGVREGTKARTPRGPPRAGPPACHPCQPLPCPMRAKNRPCNHHCLGSMALPRTGKGNAGAPSIEDPRAYTSTHARALTRECWRTVEIRCSAGLAPPPIAQARFSREPRGCVVLASRMRL